MNPFITFLAFAGYVLLALLIGLLVVGLLPPLDGDK